MKNRGLLLVFCCLMAGAACTQPRTLSKGYAYSRQTTGGAAPVGGIDEKGAALPARGSNNRDFLIWVQRKEAADLVIENVWIEGRNYAAVPEPVSTTPVMMQNGAGDPAAGKPVILVPATGNKVWQVLLKGLKSPQTPMPAMAQAAAKKGTVVIEYMAGNKRKYFSIPAVKTLGPLSLQ